MDSTWMQLLLGLLAVVALFGAILLAGLLWTLAPLGHTSTPKAAKPGAATVTG